MTTKLANDALQIDAANLKKASLFYRAVNHKLRQQMLRLLANEGRLPVTHIYVKLRLEQSVCSQHLAILRRAQLVNAERDGKNIFYSVNHQRLSLLHETAERLLYKP